MIQPNPFPDKHASPTLIEARAAFRRVSAGIMITAQRDYGDYTETVTTLIQALQDDGVEGVHRAYAVLKRANPRAAELEDPETPYPLDLDLQDAELRELDRFPYTDLGQSEAIAHLYQQRMFFAPGLGWHIWTGSRWQPDHRRAHVQIAGVVARARQFAVMGREIAEGDKDGESRKLQDLRTMIRAETKARIDAAISLAETHPTLVKDVSELDADPHLLGVKNGVVDLRTGQLLEPDPELLMTKRNNIDYVPGAPCNRWRRFLREVFQENDELIDYFQRSVGYSLTALTHVHCFWILHGTGRNGKGTINWVLSQIGGEYVKETDPKTFEARKESGTGEELASLRGARIVLASETGEGYELNEARIKAITGEDVINARYLYQSRFSFTPTFKVWLATNHKPVIRGTDTGMWSRPRLLPFAVSFLGKEDYKLKATLQRELPGILDWAVEGAMNFFRHGLGTSQAVVDATQEYREEMDTLGQWLESRVIDEKSIKVRCSDAHKDYVTWAEDAGIRPISLQRLSRALTQRGWEKYKREDGWYWKDHGLRA